MTALVHILCGPASSGKTGRLLERCRAATARGIAAVLWLSPTRRCAEHIQQQLLTGEAGSFGVRVLTFQDLADEIVRVNDPLARPLPSAQRRLLAADVVAELHPRGELAHFERVLDTRGFGEGVVNLLAELKRAEVRPKEFTQAAYRRGKRREVIGAKDRACTGIYDRYHQHLKRHHLYDVEGRLWYARDLLRQGQKQPFEHVQAVFVDGFTDFTRT